MYTLSNPFSCFCIHSLSHSLYRSLPYSRFPIWMKLTFFNIHKHKHIFDDTTLALPLTAFANIWSRLCPLVQCIVAVCAPPLPNVILNVKRLNDIVQSPSTASHVSFFFLMNGKSIFSSGNSQWTLAILKSVSFSYIFDFTSF